MEVGSENILNDNRIFLWLAFATATLLLVPLVAEWPWSPSDFMMAGVLIFGASSLFVFVARKANKKNRPLIGMAFVLAFLWLWAELAVGVFTNWGS